jgi:hypothetical protein
MDPITITTAAWGIAWATGLTDWLGRKLGGAPGEKVSRRIVDIAADVVGGASPGETIARIQSNAETVKKLRTLIVQQENELVRLNAEDTQDARALYELRPTQANAVARHIMRYNLPAIVGLLVSNAAAVYYIEDPAVAVAIGNMIGASISYMWQERQQVVGFFFGSSLGSKEKSQVINSKMPGEFA